MTRPARKSSAFTRAGDQPLGPPLIGALLRAPWEAVRRRMLQRLVAQGFGDLDAPHLNVFLYPGPQGMKPSELAARMGVTKQSLNYLLGELERMGYLARRADSEDLRSRRIVMTARGERAGRAMRAAVHEIEREWKGRLGARRFEQLRELLRKLGAPEHDARSG